MFFKSYLKLGNPSYLVTCLYNIEILPRNKLILNITERRAPKPFKDTFLRKLVTS